MLLTKRCEAILPNNCQCPNGVLEDNDYCRVHQLLDTNKPNVADAPTGKEFLEPQAGEVVKDK